MSYSLTGSVAIQSLSAAQDFQTLLKYALNSLTVDVSTIIPISLAAGVAETIDLPSVVKLQLLAIKSTQPVDLSLKLTSSNPTYSLFPSVFHLIINPTGLPYDHIKILSTVVATAEVAVAGLFQ